MSIASRIRWRRRLAFVTPSLSWGESFSSAIPVQRYVIIVWLGFVVQVAAARPKGMF